MVRSTCVLVVTVMSAALLTAGSLAAVATWEPARFESGSVPQPSIRAVGGGEVFVEVGVSAAGAVTAIRPLRDTPPFTGMLIDAVKLWTFAPAVDGSPAALQRNRGVPMPVASKVLVGAVFRPPALVGPTLGTQAADVAKPGDDAPFPVATTMPSFPTHARDGASVLLALQVDENGAVSDTTVVHSAPPFDEPARSAARVWRFRPAVVSGRAVPTLVYVIFGFPTPVL
jgi:TonB family protein